MYRLHLICEISELAVVVTTYDEVFLTFSHKTLDICSDCHIYMFLMYRFSDYAALDGSSVLHL